MLLASPKFTNFVRISDKRNWDSQYFHKKVHKEILDLLTQCCVKPKEAMHGSEDQKWSANLQRTLNKGVGGASLTIFAADCRCYKDVYVNSFFLCTARIWNSLPIECFSLTYNLSSFKSRINKHLLTVGSLQRDLLYPLIFLYFFSCNSMQETRH